MSPACPASPWDCELVSAGVDHRSFGINILKLSERAALLRSRPAASPRIAGLNLLRRRPIVDYLLLRAVRP